MYPIILRVWGEEKPVRALSEMTSSTFGGSEGRVRLVGLGNSTTGGASTASYETSSEMAIKICFYLHLCPRKYFSSQL
jgi:hypothetical protein